MALERVPADIRKDGAVAKMTDPKGCSRNYPQGGWATCFFRPSAPRDTHGIRTPQPSGHLRPTMDQIRLDPQDKLTPPLLGHGVNKTSSLHRTKKCLRSPQDNFWNSPKVRHFASFLLSSRSLSVVCCLYTFIPTSSTVFMADHQRDHQCCDNPSDGQGSSRTFRGSPDTPGSGSGHG